MIKFQYNKTSLGELGKQLKIRTRALPTLKNKETALRLEVKKAKRRSDELLEELSAALERYSYLSGLWNEFEPGLISVRDVELVTAKFAGVRIPELKDVIYDVREFNLFQKPLRPPRDRVRDLLREEPHPGLLPQEDHPEGQSVRESADTRVQ